MDREDWQVCFDVAVKTLTEMLEDMRRGALDGCDPTWAAHLAAATHEAIVAVNQGFGIIERTQK